MKRASRIVSLLVLMFFLSSQVHATEAELPKRPTPQVDAVSNSVPPASTFPSPQRRTLPSNTRLYIGLGAVAALGVGMIGYGATNSVRATGTRVRFCEGSQCGLVQDLNYVPVNRGAYIGGGAALTGAAVFGIYAVHKWRR